MILFVICPRIFSLFIYSALFQVLGQIHKNITVELTKAIVDGQNRLPATARYIMFVEKQYRALPDVHAHARTRHIVHDWPPRSGLRAIRPAFSEFRLFRIRTDEHLVALGKTSRTCYLSLRRSSHHFQLCSRVISAAIIGPL